jgi:hypothetical protein
MAAAQAEHKAVALRLLAGLPGWLGSGLRHFRTVCHSSKSTAGLALAETASLSDWPTDLRASSPALQQPQKSPFCPPVVHLGHPHASFIMLRIPLRQCSRQLQSTAAKARLSTIAASPARTNAIATCRRPMAVAPRRHYALAAEDTNKGVVRRLTLASPSRRRANPPTGPQRQLP